ncbi:hypothetical protein TURU_099942 [Turdus rufiventris]|nr:hypothetical protein TURU_099942 [Turdus rufiventris]
MQGYLGLESKGDIPGQELCMLLAWGNQLCCGGVWPENFAFESWYHLLGRRKRQAGDSLPFIVPQQAVVEDVFAKLSVETLKLPISVISDKHDKVSSIFQ